MKNKKILVTGGAGFMGSSLVKKLLDKNLEVRVLDNYQRGNGFRLNDIRSKIDFIEGDSIELEKISDIPQSVLNEIIQEAIILDQTIPYQSKRKLK